MLGLGNVRLVVSIEVLRDITIVPETIEMILLKVGFEGSWSIDVGLLLVFFCVAIKVSEMPVDGLALNETCCEARSDVGI